MANESQPDQQKISEALGSEMTKIDRPRFGHPIDTMQLGAAGVSIEREISARKDARIAELEAEVARLRAESHTLSGLLGEVMGKSALAIRDAIRRPMGVEPDSATQALRLIASIVASFDDAPEEDSEDTDGE